MTSALALPYLALFVTLFRALLVAAHVVPASCRRCGRPRERRELGEAVCSCVAPGSGR